MLGGRGLPRISEAALGRGEGPHILAAEHHRPGKPSSSLFFLASGLWSEGLRLLSKGARACFSRCRQPLEHCLRHTGKLGWSPAKPSLLAAGPLLQPWRAAGPFFLLETPSPGTPGSHWPRSLWPRPRDAGLQGHHQRRPVCRAHSTADGCLRPRLVWGLQREALSRTLLRPPASEVLLRTHMNLRRILSEQNSLRVCLN